MVHVEALESTLQSRHQKQVYLLSLPYFLLLLLHSILLMHRLNLGLRMTNLYLQKLLFRALYDLPKRLTLMPLGLTIPCILDWEVYIQALAPYIKVENKPKELIEAQTLRMDRLEVMLEDHRKEMESLKERVTVMEKKEGVSDSLLAIKADIKYSKKLVASVKSMDLSSF